MVGFIGLHAVFIGCGIAVLRALGLYPVRGGKRAAIAAVGPGLFVGAALVVPVMIVLLVLGVPLTLVSFAATAIGLAAVAEAIARRRKRSTAPGQPPGRWPGRWVMRGAAVAAGAYVTFGAFALARLPTGGDDARIWSLRGLTLAYYHQLQPLIFQNQIQSGAHPVYPLFQPVLEALMSQAAGHPQLRLYHTELWLLFVSGLWTAGYMLARRESPRRAFPIWLAVLALIAVTPAAIHNLTIGYADITGSLLLGTGALALALWIERDDAGALALAAVLLAAAASTKDEDLLAAVLVLLAGGVTALLGRGFAVWRQRRLWLWGAAAAYFVVIVAPWRIWTASHHLVEGVEPPLPRALSPVYIANHLHAFHLTARSMVTQTLNQWGWLAAIFVAACVMCFATRTARRTTGFYVAAVALSVIGLLWVYTTTNVSLAFLLPTSMDRTVDVFMVLAGFATAHLLAALVTRRATARVPDDRGRDQMSSLEPAPVAD